MTMTTSSSTARLSFFFLVLSTAAWQSQALTINLCQLFGTCNRQQQQQQVKPQPPPPPPQSQGFQGRGFRNQINGVEWVELGQKLYHFAPSNTPSVDWYGAYSYCKSKGGYLVEVLSGAEHNYLVNEVRRRDSNTNWWLGIRNTEECTCFQSGQASYEADMDQFSLSNRNDAAAKTRCDRTGFTKRCNNNRYVWRWAHTGQRASFDAWDRASGQPHGARQNEYCATMWLKTSYAWGDWPCDISRDNTHSFRAICQRDRTPPTTTEAPVYDEEDYKNGDYNNYENDDDFSDLVREDQGNRGGDVDESKACLVRDYRYRIGKNRRLERLAGVNSHEECQKKCAEIIACAFWTWRGQSGGNSRPCLLARSIRVGRGQREEGAYSGSMSGTCRELAIVKDKEDVISSDGLEVCADYGAIYTQDNQASKLQSFNRVPNADVCRARCVQNDACQYWTWQGEKSRRRRCTLLRSNSGYTFSYSSGAVSGTLNGRCRSLALSQLRKCHCDDPANFRHGQEDYDDYEYRDLVGEGLIDVRINGNEDTKEAAACQSGQALRCVAEGAEELLRTRSGISPRISSQPSSDAVVFGQ